jgi:hypothetical protein
VKKQDQDFAILAMGIVLIQIGAAATIVFVWMMFALSEQFYVLDSKMNIAYCVVGVLDIAIIAALFRFVRRKISN